MEILGNYDIKQINGFWHQSNLILFYTLIDFLEHREFFMQ